MISEVVCPDRIFLYSYSFLFLFSGAFLDVLMDLQSVGHKGKGWGLLSLILFVSTFGRKNRTVNEEK